MLYNGVTRFINRGMDNIFSKIKLRLINTATSLVLSIVSLFLKEKLTMTITFASEATIKTVELNDADIKAIIAELKELINFFDNNPHAASTVTTLVKAIITSLPQSAPS
jgi:hypothetical protein